MTPPWGTAGHSGAQRGALGLGAQAGSERRTLGFGAEDSGVTSPLGLAMGGGAAERCGRAWLKTILRRSPTAVISVCVCVRACRFLNKYNSG